MNSPALPMLARILIATLFIGLGAERLLGAAGIGPLAGTALSNATLVLSALELAAGTLLAIGRRVRVLALLLAAFLIVDAVLAHPFWGHAGGEAHAQWLHFIKNIAVVGGLLLLAAETRGRR
ncbi:MAG: DoxX family membrane protein [Xanthomonadales bacterium]|nr:DoxX family membrane protein [Xanthomonadales bacterium]